MFELLAQFGRCSMVPQLQKQHTETQVYSEENDETPWSLAHNMPKDCLRGDQNMLKHIKTTNKFFAKRCLRIV